MMGYPTELVPDGGNKTASWGWMDTGDAHMRPEVWNDGTFLKPLTILSMPNRALKCFAEGPLYEEYIGRRETVTSAGPA